MSQIALPRRFYDFLERPKVSLIIEQNMSCSIAFHFFATFRKKTSLLPEIVEPHNGIKSLMSLASPEGKTGSFEIKAHLFPLSFVTEMTTFPLCVSVFFNVQESARATKKKKTFHRGMMKQRTHLLGEEEYGSTTGSLRRPRVGLASYVAYRTKCTWYISEVVQTFRPLFHR